MSSRAIAARPGVSIPSLALPFMFGLLSPLVGCSDSSDDVGDKSMATTKGLPESTATASSATPGGAGGTSAGGANATTSGNGGEAGTGGSSAGTGGSSIGTGSGSAGTGGAGGAPDTTHTANTGSGGTGAASGPGVPCVADGAFCRVAPGPCPAMQVRAVDGSCWGDCVPIGECACAAPADCPDENQYTCHNFSGRCGPYL